MRSVAAVAVLLLLLAPAALGATFQGNVRVSGANPQGPRGNPTIAAGQGVVYLAWQQEASAVGGQDILVSKSLDGAGWSAPARVDDLSNTSLANFPDIAARGAQVYVTWEDDRNDADKSDVFFDLSGDGITWGPDRKVSDDVGGPRRVRPSIAVAPNGTTYVAYAVAGTTGDSTSVRLVASHSGGATWTPSVAVSEPGPNSRGDPRIAVAPDGKVYVAWRDGRAGTYNTPGGPVDDTKVYLANSTDGGLTFGTNVRVNTAVAQRQQTTPDIAIDANGTVFVVWADGRYNSLELTDVFFAKSTDGVAFVGETAVNDTAPVVPSPRRTNHQSPTITWSNDTGELYVAWVDDRGDLLAVNNYNVYVARSADGGVNWAPFNLGPQGATHFLEDAATYNGVRNPSEATVLAADGDLDPGFLNGTDRVVTPGRASLRADFSGTELAYADGNADGNYTAGEALVHEGRLLLFPSVEPTDFLPWHDATPKNPILLTLLRLDDSAAMDVPTGKTLAGMAYDVDAAFSVDLAVSGLLPSDSISAVNLTVRYRTAAGYAGSAALNASSGGPNVTLLVPVNTSDAYVTDYVDLFALGFDTVPELTALNVTFTNDGAVNVSFDQMTFSVLRGAPGEFDTYDAVVVGAAPAAGAPLANLTAGDRLVYRDEDADGGYDLGEAVLRAPAAASTGMDLTAQFELLPPTSGSWRLFLAPFPVNDDVGTASQYTPDLAVSDAGYLVAVWQDYRIGPWPDVQSARAAIFTPPVPVDTVPPTITHSPPAVNLQAGGVFNISAEVTDNVGVASVTLHIQGPRQTYAETHPMTWDLGQGRWFYIYATPQEEGFVSYWIEAEDAAGNTVRSPASGTHDVFVENPRREALGAFVLLFAFLVVTLPLLYLLRRGKRRQRAEESGGEEKPTEPPEDERPAEPPQK
ncbi:MAG TPA: sialidase family protein [Thermoplasmata archaeon]|nr:sialidase family protein [Thermoplasmata archaeon]